MCSNFLANLKNLFIILALISFFSSCKEEESNEISGLFINEFLASNDACCADENEEYDDWVEIYNKTESPVNIGGMYFTDKPDDDDPYKIPDSIPNKTTIPAGGFLVLWCDKDEEQGVLHLKVKLSADGGSNYSTATLTAMPDFATGIKMAKVNDLSVTAGTSLKYKLEFANQALASKEARIRGVSLQY